MISFSAEQRVIVTGASSGIGEGVALLLNELGASVIAIARRRDRLEALRDKAAIPKNIHIEVKDLTEDIAGLPLYVKQLKETYGKFYGMAYCAGVTSIQPLRAVELDAMHRLFAINYFAPVFMAKGFADKRNNCGPGSAMVFIASAGGVRCDPGMTSYAGSKGALIASIQSIARETASTGIRANCISPSAIETDMLPDVARKYAIGKYPFGLGSISDVANMVVYLLSKESRWITAQNYIIDCGAI